MKAIFTVGISASGKSKWSEVQRGFVDINRDEVRKRILLETTVYQREDNMWRFYKFSKENEDDVTQQCNAIRDRAILQGKDIIFSDTNLNWKRLQRSVSFMKSKGYDVEIKLFPVTYEEAIKRDKQRINSVGESVINKQWMDWLKLDTEQTGIKKYTKDESLPRAIIVDIDGTVAKFTTNRTAFEWNKVLTDEPIMSIVDLVSRYSTTHEIIFLSGRDSVCREDTLAWLNRYFTVAPSNLLMRPMNNFKKDRIIKGELFWNYVAPYYCIDLVIDDRKQIIREWTDISSCPNSFKLINVGNYYEDF